MSQSMVIGIARDAVLTVLYVAGPVMAVALVVGLIISVLQATTQVQEQTLTFVPKIVAVFVFILLMLPFFLAKLQAFAEEMFNNIANVLR
ncbi:MAG: flagellar biosynthesis protein FliQ [Clostridia bacterium]|nr:flagellar biosynthesis protein FliQ [Clostridia bacterium]